MKKFFEKNCRKVLTNKKTVILELDDEIEKQLYEYEEEIKKLLLKEEVPSVLNKPKCKKCAYYEYCYI